MCPPDEQAAPVEETAAPVAVEAAAPVAAAPEVPPHHGIIEGWAADLIANIEHLRTTDIYNKFRAAIEDLKSRL